MVKYLLLLIVASPVFAYNMELDIPWDYDQIEQDATKIEAAKIEAAKYSFDFDFQNKKHKTFLILNILDVATTIYAIENRTNLSESNFLLPKKPKPEELILQKVIVITTMSHLGLFSTHPADQWYIDGLNVSLGLVVISNLYNINKHD